MITNDHPIPAVFVKPDAPRNNWETFKWLFFEPSLLKNWSDKNRQNRWQNARKFLAIYPSFIAPIVIICWSLLITGFILTDFPASHPDMFKYKIDVEIWNVSPDFFSRWMFLANHLAFGLALGLALGLAFGLALGLAGGLASGLAFGLALGLAGGLAGGLARELARGLAGGLAFGLALGLAGGLPRVSARVSLVGNFGVSTKVLAGILNLFFALESAGGLVVVLPLALLLSLALGFPLGLGIIVVFYIGQFRLIFFPFRVITALGKINFIHNPYLHDEVIWLPILRLKKNLIIQAQQNPMLAFQFVDFLLRYRPLQRTLAAEIEHAATAAFWCSELILRHTLFDNRHLLEEKLPDTWKKYAPSKAWREKVIEIRETLKASEVNLALVTKQALAVKCLALVKDFEAINLRETFNGRNVYFEVIQHWNKVLGNQLSEISKKVAETHAVSLNPYSKGNALTPELAASIPLFLDRVDIKEELSLKIQTSSIMPTFLILGQRRVGKTSLVNFLPQLLDPNFYDVVAVDAQGLAGESSLIVWLNYWRNRIENKLRLPITAPTIENDPLKAWDEFAAFLDQLTQLRKRRLILVMDEYDEDRGLHFAIRQNPELGAAFLGRMRAFSQQQKMVVFMFVGATNFSDLPEPKWSRYFVQAHIVRVDYLSEEASLQLIEQPIPDFGLKYGEGVAQRIYELTQGHPHLLHSICSDLVDQANLKLKNPVEMEDLEYILHNKIVLNGEQPFSVFWDEFCATKEMQEAVKAIAFHQPIDPQTPEVRKLLDYKYIVPNGVDGYKMRVPLFEDWVRQFGY